ncbi:uncharacterized protein NPIL_489841 [Nephila pilipes]|uniref:Ribosomal protein eL8/eL30/eS12/Gadd45 domain-containing protein n=1 Tax=Nephila pilipes TaxID=299642 RepID=A0A8X6U3N6_NEPPI|nr:uncharacterized protein NPIL_489841 [Nephila pilipes]
MGRNKCNKRKLEFEKSEESENKQIIHNSIIKEISSLSKPKGLVVGTNEVLRLLEKEKLGVVFLFSAKASPSIFHTLSQWCKATDVPFITLLEKDKVILGSQFPVSVSYGILKESLKELNALDDLLKQGQKNKKQAILSCDSTSKHTKLLPVKESAVCKKQEDVYTCYHTHKKLFAKQTNVTKADNFISLHLNSKVMDFLDYDSVIKSDINK